MRERCMYVLSLTLPLSLPPSLFFSLFLSLCFSPTFSPFPSFSLSFFLSLLISIFLSLSFSVVSHAHPLPSHNHFPALIHFCFHETFTYCVMRSKISVGKVISIITTHPVINDYIFDAQHFQIF